MLFPIITFITAITIAAIAAWFSVAGLMAIFTASAISVAIMAVALEVGKLVSASWVYRNWKRAPFLLKSYLTVAVIILMLITSMGIFGFLSKAHLEQAADSEENTARIERIVQDMSRYESTNDRFEKKIVTLDAEGETDTSKVQEQIDQEETRMDNFMVRIQPSIDEQNVIITNERAKDDDKVAPYLNQLDNLDNELVKLEEQAKKYENDITNVGKDTTSYDYAVKPFQDQIEKIKSDIATFKEMSKSGEQADIKKAQAVVGIPWGYWRNAEVLKEWNTEQALNISNLGTKVAEVRKDFERQYKLERIRLSNMVTKLRGLDTQRVNERKMELLVKIEQARGIESSVISSAREEIKRLREKADREVAGSLIILDRLRNALLNVSQIDNSVVINELQVKINSNDAAIVGLLDQKFELEREIRKIATEIGPIKYLAEMVYDNTDNETIDEAVRWLIIVFIFVFDPLAVLLLIAANYSFQHRNDHNGRQEEISEKLFSKKKVAKPLDIQSEIRDNRPSEVIDTPVIPEEIAEVTVHVDVDIDEVADEVLHLDFEDGIELEIEDEIEFKIDEVEIITPTEVTSIPEQSWAKMTEVEIDEVEIDEVKITPPVLTSKIDKVIVVPKEEDIGTGRFNITANDDGVSVDVDEEVIGVILDDVELDEVKKQKIKKKVKKDKQRKINTKAIRRDGWLDDVDNKR